MRLAKVSKYALPAWAMSNNVTFDNIALQEIEGKGFGIVVKEVTSVEKPSIQPLLRVPQALVLSAKAITEHARVDEHFRELLAAAGGLSHRGDVMLFLLIHMTINSPDCSSKYGVAAAWTEYIKMLPEDVPVPTSWTDTQRRYLNGTSLEIPLSAKLLALSREFETLKRVTGVISWCREVWWEPSVLVLNDWIILDAWYRSRVLQLPSVGDCMVPCIDMVNHSAYPQAYYEEETNGDITVLRRPGAHLLNGEEVCITYGSEKSAAEILFSYGFVAEDAKCWKMVLDLRPPPDDPLGGAKLAVFKGRPVVELTYDAEEDTIQWASEFIFLMVLNEEDGLQFRVSQESDDSKGKLLVFWQDTDVTETTEQFAEYIATSKLCDIFQLRALALLESHLAQQQEQLSLGEERFTAMKPTLLGHDERIWHTANQLRLGEQSILEMTLQSIQAQKSQLFSSPAVTAYLGLNVGGKTLTQANN